MFSAILFSIIITTQNNSIYQKKDIIIYQFHINIHQTCIIINIQSLSFSSPSKHLHPSTISFLSPFCRTKPPHHYITCHRLWKITTSEQQRPSNTSNQRAPPHNAFGSFSIFSLVLISFSFSFNDSNLCKKAPTVVVLSSRWPPLTNLEKQVQLRSISLILRTNLEKCGYISFNLWSNSFDFQEQISKVARTLGFPNLPQTQWLLETRIDVIIWYVWCR